MTTQEELYFSKRNRVAVFEMVTAVDLVAAAAVVVVDFEKNHLGDLKCHWEFGYRLSQEYEPSKRRLNYRLYERKGVKNTPLTKNRIK